jgi:C4-dicarboxylate-specific signal transduction histidine kinase
MAHEPQQRGTVAKPVSTTIFDAFDTTKPDGMGMGMGMGPSVGRSIIDRQ